MAMDLYGKQGYFRWSTDGWNKVLELADQHGWEPAGTQPSRNAIRRCRSAARRAGKRRDLVERAVERLRASFHGYYWTNEQQIVTANDARHLAGALERALSAVSAIGKGALRKNRRGAIRKRGGVNTADAPMLSLPGDHRMLRSFIKHCRRGRFEIW